MKANSRVMLGALIVLVVVVAAIVWSTRSTAPVPEFQNRVAVPGMQPHPVSLWIDPSPARVGETRLTVQVADPSGMPIPVESVSLYVFPDGSFPSYEWTTTYTSEAPIHDFLGRGHGYTARVTFPESGRWNIEVHFTLPEATRSTLFEVEVGD